MHTNSKITLAIAAGAALGAAAIQGLHAQDKLKAYSIAEVESVGSQTADLPILRKEIEAAGGRPLGTIHGRVVRIEGAPPPEHLSVVEWDNLEAALEFYKSKAWTDGASERDKTQKTIRRYVVEAEKR